MDSRFQAAQWYGRGFERLICHCLCSRLVAAMRLIVALGSADSLFHRFARHLANFNGHSQPQGGLSIPIRT